MAKVYDKLSDLIGQTPMLTLHRVMAHTKAKGQLLAKLEAWNPAGSVKDRVAKRMIEAAEAEGRLSPGATIIEPTSGNTGIGLASLAAAKGYEIILTMPETMSVERRKLLAAYGAKLVLTEGALGMAGAIAKAEVLLQEIPNSFMPSQFENPSNPAAHYATTGPEIWEQTEGKVDVLVAGVGTGGTLTGSGRYLKEQNPAIEVVAVEPFGSPVLSEGRKGPHGLQGIGAGFVPKVLDTDLYDRVMTVKEEDAYAMARIMAAKEGLLIGISSGAALWAAVQLAEQEAYAGKRIVVVLPDTGDRYLSTPLFFDEA